MCPGGGWGRRTCAITFKKSRFSWWNKIYARAKQAKVYKTFFRPSSCVLHPLNRTLVGKSKGCNKNAAQSDRGQYNNTLFRPVSSLLYICFIQCVFKEVLKKLFFCSVWFCVVSWWVLLRCSFLWYPCRSFLSPLSSWERRINKSNKCMRSHTRLRIFKKTPSSWCEF